MNSASLSDLELAITAWAAQTTLPPQRSLAMRAEILAIPPDPAPEIETQPLPTTWWPDFSARLNEQLYRSLHAATSSNYLESTTPLGFGWNGDYQAPAISLL